MNEKRELLLSFLFLIGMGISFTVHDTSSNVIVVRICRL
ncbi:hypothetical protein BCE_4130 [Bacillus cereus ATCC 10987]|uniref:Uncharacterized protein n=1 Tax=Bacillus cereus (strain ATCC 10987 / NRS 248) TaxID=222523 RepID=Q731N5_BACC1|nr:hypothetical protein BCE_4130 [Bacillus cereus ATCC 10987]